MSIQRQCVAFFNAYSQGKAGGDSVFIEVTKRLSTCKILVVTSKLGEIFCRDHDLSAEYLITSHETSFTNIITIYLQRIWKAFFLNIHLNQNDILLGSSDFLPDVLPIWYIKQKNHDVIWAQHIFHLIPSRRKISFYAQKLSFFFIKRFANVVIVDNHLLKEDLLKLGFSEKKIFVNYPGIDVLYLQSIPKTSVQYDGVMLAQLRSAKGLMDLIDIWVHVCKKIPIATLAIIGKGQPEFVEMLKTKIVQSGLEKQIKLLGFLPDEKAFSVIKNSKVFVFPSHEEGFGIAPLQAQALGLPVVAWNLPVFAEVFPQGMIKVELKNKEKFSNEVINLLKNKSDYQNVSKSAEENSKRFSFDKTALAEVEFLDRLTI